MQRRTILKTFAALAATAATPLFAKDTPTTAQELKAWMERKFLCRQGDPKAFHTLLGQRFYYTTLRAQALETSEAFLVSKLHAQLAALKADVLFWRLPEKVRFQEEVVERYGGDSYSMEALEDRAHLQHAQRQYVNHSVRGTERKLPWWVNDTPVNTVKLPPEAAELHFNPNNGRYYTHKDVTTYGVLRTRIALLRQGELLDSMESVAYTTVDARSAQEAHEAVSHDSLRKEA